jgi:hypothetical protein
MEELVFCCPQCLHVASAGIVTDISTMMRSQHRPIFITCKVCRRINCILVEDALITTSFDSRGSFIPLARLEAVDAEAESV